MKKRKRQNTREFWLRYIRFWTRIEMKKAAALVLMKAFKHGGIMGDRQKLTADKIG